MRSVATALILSQVGGTLTPLHAAEHFRCQGRLGIAVNTSSFPSAVDLGPVCVSQRPFTCCTLNQAEQLVAWDRACETAADDAGRGATCCTNMRKLRCYACDGLAGVGLGTPICSSFVDELWSSCKDVFVSSSENSIGAAFPQPCSSEDLLCTMLSELHVSGSAFVEYLGLAVAGAIDGSGCFKGKSTVPNREFVVVMEAVAQAQGLIPSSAVDSTQAVTRRRQQRAAEQAAAEVNSGDSAPSRQSGGDDWWPMPVIRRGLYAALHPLLGTATAWTIASNAEAILLGLGLSLLAQLLWLRRRLGRSGSRSASSLFRETEAPAPTAQELRLLRLHRLRAQEASGDMSHTEAATAPIPEKSTPSPPIAVYGVDSGSNEAARALCGTLSLPTEQQAQAGAATGAANTAGVTTHTDQPLPRHGHGQGCEPDGCRHSGSGGDDSDLD
jgi:hypothetical protein